MLAHAFALGVPAPHVPAALAGPNPGNARSTALASLASSWTLDPRVYEEPGQFTGCPEGQRNAVESECFAAVQEVTHALGLFLEGQLVKVVDAGPDGWVPSGCSYSRGHGKRAMFNRNPAGRSTGSYPLVCIKDEVQIPSDLAPEDRTPMEADEQQSLADKRKSDPMDCWYLDNRTNANPHVTSPGCPAGQRSPKDDECFKAVAEAAELAGLDAEGLTAEFVFMAAADDKAPSGCSYSHATKSAVFNRDTPGCYSYDPALLPYSPECLRGSGWGSATYQLVCKDCPLCRARDAEDALAAEEEAELLGKKKPEDEADRRYETAMATCASHASRFEDECRCYDQTGPFAAPTGECSAQYERGACAYTSPTDWLNGVSECAVARGLTTAAKPGIGHSVDLVVSHCSINIGWIDELEQTLARLHTTPKTFIYTKCGNWPDPSPWSPDGEWSHGRIVYRLSNVGRCDHTFAHHIVERYDDLPDTLLFVKDSTFAAPQHRLLSVRATDWMPLLLANRGGFICGREPCHGSGGDPCYGGEEGQREAAPDAYGSVWHLTRTLVSFGTDIFPPGGYRTGHEQNRRLDLEEGSFSPRAHFTMGDWWNETFSADLATELHSRAVVPVCYGGTFGVSNARQALQRISRDDWVALRDSLSRADSIIEGHFAERSWMALLTPPLDAPIGEELAMAVRHVRRARPDLAGPVLHPYTGIVITSRTPEASESSEPHPLAPAAELTEHIIRAAIAHGHPRV